MANTRKIAITQPYIFPYINYFHLIQSVEQIVFYDDINYIPGGWINKNRILLSNRDHTITIPVKQSSQNNKTNKTELAINEKFTKKTLKTLEHAYKKAPYYNEIMNLICETFTPEHKTISDLAISSIVKTFEYLDSPIKFHRSSILAPETINEGKSERLVSITKKLDASNYVNVEWGNKIHKKEYFYRNKVNLLFLKSGEIKYTQFENEMIPNLSIIDALMFNSKEEVLNFFQKYVLT